MFLSIKTQFVLMNVLMAIDAPRAKEEKHHKGEMHEYRDAYKGCK